MNKHLETALTKFAAEQKFKVGERSHFEGDKYIIAEPFTIGIQSADKRCGNRFALVLHLPNGCIAPLFGYYPPIRLERELLNPTMDYQSQIQRYKQIHRIR